MLRKLNIVDGLQAGHREGLLGVSPPVELALSH